MRLSRFIIENMEEILREWESFARTLVPAADGMSPLELRDHAQEMLEAIALDIETAQNPEQQEWKSKALPELVSAGESAASTHGTLRQVSGFTLLQLTSEFRALRATVLRLWLPTLSQVSKESSNDMVRFNEAIDQALAESANTYSRQTERTRDTFLAILGHDLRGPLATMTSAGDLLTIPGTGTERTEQVGVRVKRSARMMTSMVNDLLEYARTQLGSSIPIVPRLANVSEICRAALEDARAVYPDCTFQADAPNDLWGEFDHIRVQQVIANLLNNAAQYRSKAYPVTLAVGSEPTAVVVEVKNRGPVIPPDALQVIFNPLVQVPSSNPEQDRPSGNLGLGLFIARQITVAHGGTLSATSSERDGTAFTLRLPWKHGG